MSPITTPCVDSSGTMPGESTNKTNRGPRPKKFYQNEPHLTQLETSKLIIAAEYLLSGVNPPESENSFFSWWVQDEMFEHSPNQQRDMMSLLLDRDGIAERDAEKPENQRKLLELAIRECLEGVRTLPSFRNLNLTNGILQTYRRELIWLVGKWIEVSA